MHVTCSSPVSGMPLADTHSHFDFVTDPAALAGEAIDAGILALATTVTPPEFVRARDLLRGFENIRVGLGLHPWWLADGRCTEEDLGLFEQLAISCQFIGEIGIDHSKRLEGTFELQQDAFVREVTAALSGNDVGSAPRKKVFSIHAVRCASLVLDILEDLGAPELASCVFHWFSGTTDDLWRAIDLGCWFSVGAHTLRSGRGREYAKVIPAGRLLLETDAPGLEGDTWTCTEWRDSLEQGVALLAKVRKEDEVSLAQITTRNARELLAM